MKRRTFVTTVATGMAVPALAGCTESDSGDTASGGDGDNGSGETTEDNSGGTTEGNSGGTTATDTTEQTTTTTSGSSQSDVEILDHSMEYDDTTGAKVVGAVKNTTDSEQSYIQVQARFFDDSDTRIGEGLWNASDVGAGREVQFETIPAMVENEPARYTVEASTSL